MIKTLIQKLSLRKPLLPKLPGLTQVKKEFLHSFSSISLVWQILFFYFPLLFLLVRSFVVFDSAGGFVTISFSHFSPVLNASYYKVIANSLVLSLLTGAISVLVAFPLTHFLVFKTKRWKYLLLFFLIIPFWTNFLLHIYAWFFILEKNGLVDQALHLFGLSISSVKFLHTKIATLTLMIYYYLPFAALPIFSALERFNVSFYEASLTLGANRVKTYLNVVLPLIQKALISGFFLVFIPAFGEFLIPEFIGGDKTYYVGNVISLYLIGEKSEGVGLAFTTLSVAILMIASIFIYLVLKTLFAFLQGGKYDK